jgi:hypothetical protein
MAGVLITFVVMAFTGTIGMVIMQVYMVVAAGIVAAGTIIDATLLMGLVIQ